MSDGASEYARQERIRQQAEREQIKKRIVSILDDYKWVIADDIISEIEYKRLYK